MGIMAPGTHCRDTSRCRRI